MLNSGCGWGCGWGRSGFELQRLWILECGHKGGVAARATCLKKLAERAVRVDIVRAVFEEGGEEHRLGLMTPKKAHTPSSAQSGSSP